MKKMIVMRIRQWLLKARQENMLGVVMLQKIMEESDLGIKRRYSLNLVVTLLR